MRDLESEACQECGFYGEPNGCNRLTGTCSAYHLVLELQTENTKLRAVVDAARVDRGRCNECCHHGRHCNLYKVCEALEVLDKEESIER